MFDYYCFIYIYDRNSISGFIKSKYMVSLDIYNKGIEDNDGANINRPVIID